MGLRAKSRSMPKLTSRIVKREEKLLHIGTTTQQFNEESRYSLTNVNLVQLNSGRQPNKENTDRDDIMTEKKNNASQRKNDSRQKDSMRSDSRNGISGRIRVLFQSLFNLDKKAKDGLISSPSFGSQLDSNFELIENMAYVKCRSMPELNKIERATKNIKKSMSFRHQKPFFSSLLRKSRRRLNSFRERNQSSSSLQRETQFESSPDVTFDDRSLRRKHRTPSTGFNDISCPNSPTCASSICLQNPLQASPENTPVFAKESMYKPSNNLVNKDLGTTEIQNDRAKSRRERFRRSKTTGSSFMGLYGSTSFSLSESSDIAEEAEAANEVIISNASAVAQRRRKTNDSNGGQKIKRSKEKEFGFVQKSCEQHEECQSNGTVSHPRDDCNKELRVLVEEELKKYLSHKEFESERSKDYCTRISDAVRSKIQQATKGVYKIAVQIFIGAVEEEGISTAIQCNMDPDKDGFTAVSYRNESLFAFASVLLVDFMAC